MITKRQIVDDLQYLALRSSPKIYRLGVNPGIRYITPTILSDLSMCYHLNDLLLSFPFKPFTFDALSKAINMRFLRCLRTSKCANGVRKSTTNISTVRKLHSTAARHTDGVYNALTEMRVRTPWIEALRRKEEATKNGKSGSNEPATPSDRDLTPKKMSDSYHRVVSMSPDPNLSARLIIDQI